MTFILILLIIFATLVLNTLVPNQADRATRKPPYVTWGLIGVNVFLFLTTVFVSLVNIPADRIKGQGAVETILEENQSKMSQVERDALKNLEALPSNAPAGGAEMMEKVSSTLRKTLAYKYASENIKTEEDLARLFQIQHMESTYVLEPHYSVLNVLAYRPADSSIIGKIVGLIGSMFLHGSISHLVFNMIYLFVFGRALEDALGSRIYLGAYLLCGIAAAMLHHAMSMFLNPQSMLVPYLGASGAIGGVLGLFALRFYRTSTTIFLAFPLFFLAIFLYVGSLLATGNVALLLTNLMSGNDTNLETIFSILVVIAMIAFKPDKLKPTIKIPSAWAIGLWLVVFNILPILQQFVTKTSGSTAYWAHVGGLMCGALYGLLIGSKEEGKHEFMLEDAEKAYNLGDMIGAVSYSQNVLEREPGNPNAYEIMGKAWMKQNKEEEALDNFETAIDNYLRVGEREKASAAYLMALDKYPLFILKPESQLAVGNQMAKEYNFKASAENLVKIPYTFPDAKEGEIALLRGAQLYLQHLHQPQTSLQLLQHFWQKYPESQWMPQVERAWKMAQHQIELEAQEQARLAAEQAEAEASSGNSSEPQRVRAVAPALELDPAKPAKTSKK